MFTAQEILARIKKQPFEPLRIITSSGDRYDVYHPDLVVVGTRYLFLGTASADNPAISDRYSILATMHVTALETLPTPAGPANQNGPQV